MATTETIQTFLDHLAEMKKSGPEAAAALYSDDAKLMPNHHVPIAGKQFIEEYYKSKIEKEQTNPIDIKFNVADILESGDVVIADGDFKASKGSHDFDHGNYTGSPDDACSLACAKPPPPGFGQHLMNFREPSADAMKAIYNKDFLTKVCAYANETATCVKACPDTQRRAYLRELFAPIKYVCVDSHIVQNADCLRQALEEVGPSCLTGQCAAKKAAAEQSFNAYKTATAGSMDLADQSASTKPVVEDLVGKACDLVKCGVTCGDAVRTQKCGAEANQEVHNFYKELAKSLDAVRYLSPRSYVIDVPQQCKAQ